MIWKAMGALFAQTFDICRLMNINSHYVTFHFDQLLTKHVPDDKIHVEQIEGLSFSQSTKLPDAAQHGNVIDVNDTNDGHDVIDANLCKWGSIFS